MKNLAITLLCSLSTFVIFAQEANVEKSIFRVQTGVFGLWDHNETKLNDQFILRSEIGLEDQFLTRAYYNSTSNVVLRPVLNLEPRWYYNLNKRLSQSKDIDGNAGNFAALKLSYLPDWFTVGNAPGRFSIPLR